MRFSSLWIPATIGTLLSLPTDWANGNETGLVIRTEPLQMTGLNPGNRVIRTDQLQMTGFNPGSRVVRAGQLQMTGLAETRKIGISEAENPALLPPGAKQLQYPVYPLRFPVETN